MRINNINIKQDLNINSKAKKVSFESKRQIYKIKRASLKELESKIVYEKASEWVNKIPNGKMEKTIICNVNNKKFGLRWDTKNENNLILRIKDHIDSSDTLEWDKNKDNQTVLDLFFDKNGIIQSGTIIKKIKDTYSLNAYYQRNSNNRMITMNGITYKPCAGTDEYWTSIPEMSCYSIKKDINLKDALHKAELAELFCELIKKNTTIK